MKNIKIYLLLFLFLAISVPCCWALPDLYISESDISFSPDYPKADKKFTISATVHNSSSSTSYSERVFAKNTREAEPELREHSIYHDWWEAQSFQYTEDVNLTGVSLYIRDIGNDDSLNVTIETNTVDNLPSGFEIASSTGSGGWWDWKDFTFPEVVPLSKNTTYWIVTHNYAEVESDGYKIAQTTDCYTDGRLVYSLGQGATTWVVWPNRDLLFKAYRSTRTVVEFYYGDRASNKLIGTDEISPVPKGESITASIQTSTCAGSRDIYVYVNPNNYIVESDTTTNNEAHKTIFVDFPRVESAETIDDDLNGCIDAYHIVFDEAVNDSDKNFDPKGFRVKGHDIIGVLTTLENHPDELDNNEIYLCFRESGVPDTGSLPQITYSSTTGKLTDLDGYPLLDIGEEDIRETDGTSPAIYSLLPSPRDGALGVPVDTSIQIIFTKEMKIYTTTSAIKVEAIVNKDGEFIPPDVVLWSFSSFYNATTYRHKFIFKPDSPLKNNYTYRVTVDTTATDTSDHNLAGFEFSFTTISNCKESNTFVSGDRKMKLFLDAGTLKEDFSVEISTSPLNDPQKKTAIINANKKLVDDDDPFSFTLKSPVVEIEASDANGSPITDTFQIPATITLSYKDSNQDGFVDVDGASPQLREETLKVYWLDESHNLWVKLSGSKVYTDSNRVSADTFHFSIFSLHGEGTTDLSDAYAFPVPFIPSRGDDDITFTNISPLCTIKIYTLNGELVRTIEHTSTRGETSHSWDVTNDSEDRLASGVYLYLIKNDKNKKKGKLIIIR